MKTFFKIIISLIAINGYSQSRDTIYFMIDKKDTLVKKHTMTKKNPFNGYEICFTEKEQIKKNNTPHIDGKVWVADTKYDYYVYGHKSYIFDFNNSKNNIVDSTHIKSIKYIEAREKFLKTKNLLFKYTIFFIEPIHKGKFKIREMFPVFNE